MKSFTLLLSFVISSTVHAIVVNIPELGDVRGINSTTAWTNRTIHQFLGIKFGKSTSGEKRFMPPEQIAPWEGIYDATTQGIECPQIGKLGDLINAPPDADMEDCLMLNLFTPKIPESQNSSDLLPVLVYFHGGGFYEGSAHFFPPNYLLEQDIIFVVPQYRLGALGFMSLQDDVLPGNAGFMDQILSLEWINKNIKYFGGDNTRVTISGQSAGACSVSLHLMSPMVDPKLFQQAIVMSGSSFAPWAFEQDPLSYSKNLFSVLTNTTENVDASIMAEEFKNISVLEFMLAVQRQFSINPLMALHVNKAVVQKTGSPQYISESPRSMLNSGKFRTVPMMAGVTKHDGSFLTTYVYDALERLNLQNNDYFLRNNLTKYLLEFSHIFDETNTLVDVFNNLYFKELFEKNNNLTFKDVAPAVTDIIGTSFLKAQTLKQAKTNVVYENQTYFYTLDYRGEHTRFGYGQDTSKYPFDGGVHHSDDLLYLYPYPYTTPLNEQDTIIAKLMSQLWSNFAINGKPTSDLLNVEWLPMEKDKNGPYLHLNSTSYVSMDFVDEEYRIASIESGLISQK